MPFLFYLIYFNFPITVLYVYHFITTTPQTTTHILIGVYHSTSNLTLKPRGEEPAIYSEYFRSNSKLTIATDT